MHRPPKARASRRGPLLSVRPLILALQLTLGCTVGLPTLAQTAAVSDYDIPAGPLEDALNRYALRAGVSIVVDAEKLRGLQTEGLKGPYDVEAGFNTLLRRSGYVIGRTAAGYILLPQPAVRPSSQGERSLEETVVRAERESAGSFVMDRHVMDAMSSGNGDITSLLRALPNIQFDNSQLHTGRQGEIAPADISINGAKFYQNLYQLDGMGFNNDIDPGGSKNYSAISEIPSASQGYAIDSSLLCKITVRDSNVPASYGGFMGGVVSADTCAPTKDFSGQVSIGHTRSSWMKYKIAPEEQVDYENPTSPDNARAFEKWTYRVALQTRPTENVGVIASFIRRTSTIPLDGNSAYRNGNGGRAEETRLTDNLFLRTFWKPNADNDVDVSVQYAPTSDQRIISGIKDSAYNYEAGGLGLNAGLATRLDGLLLSQRLTATSMESSRDGETSLYKTWRYSATDKNWGTTTLSNEGGYGDVDQTQAAQTYLLKADWNSQELLSMIHRFQVGMELGHKESSYHRKTQYESYSGPATWTAATCTRADGSTDPYCSTADTANGWTGQYLRTRAVYLAGKFTVSDTSRALFVQDEIRKGRLTARLGLRYEDTQLAPESTLAPRSAFIYDLQGNGNTLIEAGANRYYGRSFMAYYMQANRLSLQSTISTRTGLVDWGPLTMATTYAGYNFEQLRMPYDDEMMLALRHKAAGVQWGIKYVDRQSHDQVVQVLRSAGNRWLDNVGRSEAQTLTLTAETLRPLQAGSTRTSVMGGLDWINSQTSHVNYFDGSHDFNDDKMVVYNGELISALDMPADNYSRPWSARLLFSTLIPSANLTAGNFLRYRAGYQKMVASGTAVVNGTSYDNYERRSFSGAFTWDMRFNWDLPGSTQFRPYITLSIDNVLDRTNTIENSGTYLLYEKGRQFWLELGAKF